MPKLAPTKHAPAISARVTAYPSSGFGPSHHASAAAEMIENRIPSANALPGCFGGFPPSSTVFRVPSGLHMPASRPHVRPNTFLAYQMPPTKKPTTPATSVAIQLMSPTGSLREKPQRIGTGRAPRNPRDGTRCRSSPPARRGAVRSAAAAPTAASPLLPEQPVEDLCDGVVELRDDPLL